MRSFLAANLLILLLPGVVIANSSLWARQTILDERAFTTVVGRALDSDAIRDRLAARATTIVLDKIYAADSQTQQIMRLAFGLNDVPDRQLVDVLLRPKIAAALEEPAVRDERDRIMASAHRFVVTGAAGSSEFVRIVGPYAVLDLSPVVELLAAAADARLANAGLTDFSGPDASVVLAEAGRLRTVGSTLEVLGTTGTGLPIALGAGILLIVALAHRRIRALGLVGLTVMIAGVVCLTVATLAREFAQNISDQAAVNVVAGETYDAFATLLMEQSIILALVGGLVALVAWIALRLRGSED
ncbi:MAG TPA: hypothetical protein VGQ02_11895 [Candidatus Limnocylindrales bacterium]|jgi:hypothetical protein|nr:hypothetical protein [Candidatus Limnocylindrales bacterium]